MSEVKPRSLVPADLNEGQKEAYIQMRTFIESHGDHMYLLEGYAGTGKAQPLYSKILTPNGWTTMGNIKVGDPVISSNGQSSTVLGVFPQGKRKIYRVHFSDGSSTECCDEHLWTVQNYNQRNGNGKWQTLPLSKIKEDLEYCGRVNYNVPLVDPVEYIKQRLPLDPYLLGLLLGDGCISQKTSVKFSSSDPELIEYISESCTILGCTFNEYNNRNEHIEGGISAVNGSNIVLQSLKDLKLQGSNSKTKFIPDIYLRAPITARISLLQGLFDTDGYFSKFNLSYSTSSVSLKNGVIELVRSLGGIATYTTKIPTYTYKGVKRQGALSYTVNIKLPPNIEPFRLKRKKIVHIPKTKYTAVRYINKVVLVGILECQCISIDNPSHLYVTDDYILTHNTYLVGKIIRYIKDKHPQWRIAVTAPTNKAVKVLMRSGSINDNKIKFQTIHKLLGLKEEITADGKQIFTKNKYEECSIEEHHVIIIDEVSMLNDDLFQEIQQYGGVVKIIFMGDPAQIPPVGREDCIPFKEKGREKYKIDRFSLTEIMRQTEGNPILKAGFALREDLNNPSSPIPPVTDLNEEGHGLDFVPFSDPKGRVRMSALLEEYFVNDEFKAHSDHAKVIAWRNKTIGKLNHIIRSLIYKGHDNIGKIMNGEKLVANKPIMDKYKIMLFTTNDEFEVVRSEILHRTIASDTEAIRLQYYHTTVEYFDLRGQRQVRKIDILHEDSSLDFERVLTGLKKYAITKKGYEAKKAWVKYYEFMRQFADVGYNYAITCHKAQGSTYKNVFIIEDDIDTNQNIFERNRIKYTAYTRASNTVFVVKS